MEGHTVFTEKTIEAWKHLLTSTGSQRVFEIGFNHGHSAQILLALDCTVHSIDINQDCLEKMQKIGGDFSYEIKDSRHLKASDYENFDLVFIDGAHEKNILTSDLRFATDLGAKYIVVDDYHPRWFPWIPVLIHAYIGVGTIPYEIVRTYNYDASDGENTMVLLKCIK